METAKFFSAGWQAYEAIVVYDYLWHNLANQALLEQIARRFGPTTPVSFLDLACGDAASTSRVLRDRPLKRYVGVDQSTPALASAARNVERLRTETSLVTADYVEYLETARERFDVIYIGLSAHHLGVPGLPRFFAAARRRLADNGVLVAFEPFTLPDETRDEHVERLCKIIEHFWIKMTPEHRGQVSAHIRASDYPIPQSKWDELAVAAGLSPALVAMQTPDRISQVVVHTAGHVKNA